MSILRRHITKEILAPSAIAFAVMTFLVLVGQVLQEMVKRFSSKGLGLSDIALIILYLLPSLIAYTLPIALLFGTLIAFAQLSQDGEIIAMKAAGIPTRKAFAPSILIGVVATVAVLVLQLEVSPLADRQLRVHLVDMVLKMPTLVLNEQAWTREVNDMRIFVGGIDDKKKLLKDINIVMNDKNKTERTIVAQSGKIYIGDQQTIFLELRNGSIHEYNMKNPSLYAITTFKSLTIPANIRALDHYVKAYRKLDNLKLREMTFTQIFPMLSNLSIPTKERFRLLRNLSERAALAFMSLTFMLIGPPLGIIPYKARRFYGLAICAGLLIIYYFLLVFSDTLADKNLMNPLIAVWIPNVFLGAAGVLFIMRTERW